MTSSSSIFRTRSTTRMSACTSSPTVSWLRGVRRAAGHAQGWFSAIKATLLRTVPRVPDGVPCDEVQLAGRVLADAHGGGGVIKQGLARKEQRLGVARTRMMKK